MALLLEAREATEQANKAAQDLQIIEKKKAEAAAQNPPESAYYDPEEESELEEEESEEEYESEVEPAFGGDGD